MSIVHPGVRNLISNINVTPQKPAGATKFFTENWGKLTQDPNVLNILRDGLKIPLMSKPKQKKLPKEISYCSEMRNQVKQEILTLREKRAVKKVHLKKNQLLSNFKKLA